MTNPLSKPAGHTPTVKQVLGDGAGEAEREAFEAFCMKRWGGSDRGMLETREDGEYINGRVQFAWSAFEEARAQLAPTTSGWVLYSADFSVQASDPQRRGWVTLRRDAKGYAEWLALETLEAREGFELFRTGAGMTFAEAFANAAAPVFQPQHGEEA